MQAPFPSDPTGLAGGCYQRAPRLPPQQNKWHSQTPTPNFKHTKQAK